MRRWARVGGLNDESSTKRVFAGGERSGTLLNTAKSFEDDANCFSSELYCARRAGKEAMKLMQLQATLGQC
jgi:hypothetical protein